MRKGTAYIAQCLRLLFVYHPYDGDLPALIQAIALKSAGEAAFFQYTDGGCILSVAHAPNGAQAEPPQHDRQEGAKRLCGISLARVGCHSVIADLPAFLGGDKLHITCIFTLCQKRVDKRPSVPA